MTLVATSAKASSGSGSTVLFSQTLGANAASIDTGANGIAQTSSAIEIWVTCRTTQAVVLSTALLRVNGDTGANYDWESVAGNNVSTSAANVLAAASWGSGAVPGASATAGQVGVFCLIIPQYVATTFRKTGTLLNTMNEPASAANNFAIAAAISWRNTAAITQFSVTAGSGNLLAGSSLVVYGRT